MCLVSGFCHRLGGPQPGVLLRLHQRAACRHARKQAFAIDKVQEPADGVRVEDV
jgi:hypothetical protein